jgi:hypothetical protein
VSGTNEVFGAFPVVDTAGTIYIFYESRLPGTLTQLDAPNRSIRIAKPTDGGNTFPITPRLISTNSPNDREPLSILNLYTKKIETQKYMRPP